jgi:hypothetical protein
MSGFELFRHPRESRSPEATALALGFRLRGNDGKSDGDG